MKRKFSILVVGLVIAGVVLSLVGVTLVSQAKPESMVRKIVVFEEGTFVNEPARNALVKKFNGEMLKELPLIKGMSVLLPPRAEVNLIQQAGVLRIDDDVEVFALVKPVPVQPAETLPWGVDRIDADLVWRITTGDSIKVAIIDTGIDVKHPDLINNLIGGVSTVNYTASYNDDNGHGTHVAGIVAAINNEIGVIGVGHQIDLYAVKVLDRRGSGYLSDVIEGLDWCIQNGMQVVNMSLGTNSYNASFEVAVKAVNTAGIIQVAAAGNNYGGAVTYPAKFAEVIAVSAIDSVDKIATFSSVGPEVDLAAPGVNIYSTYKGSTYKTLSGTSMASPHVAGTAALVLTQTAKCDIVLVDGICSPAEVQKRLQDTAEVLPGLTGSQQGAGLVDAENAVIQ